MSDTDTGTDAAASGSEAVAEGCPGASGTEDDRSHPATGLFTLLGRSHAIPVLAHLVHGDRRTWRFTELESTLEVPPNTLTTRLQEFAEVGLVERRSYDEIPPRVEYEATDRARDLDPVFRELRAWMERHGDPGLDAEAAVEADD